MTKHVYKTIIFGAGQIGQMTARLLGNSYQIMCFADNDPRKHGQFIGNIPICSPSKAAALLPDLIILGSGKAVLIRQEKSPWKTPSSATSPGIFY